MKAFGEFFNNQIEYATTVALSRSQKATPEQLELCVKQIQALNPKAAVITTPWDEIKGEQILKVVEGQDSLEVKLLAEQHAKEEALEHEHEHHHDHEHDHHHHHADDVFTSWGTETPKKYEKAELDSILKKLSESEDYGKVLRSKGMLPCTDGTWMYFDLVPEEYEIREGSADFTGRICVIGSELKEDALKELFEV